MPNPLFGELLEQIDDMAELRCTLRLVWLLHQKKGSPRWVSLKELMADRALLRASSAGGRNAEAEILRGLELAVRHGIILASGGADAGSERYTLNTEEGRRAADAEPDGDDDEAETTPWEGPGERPNIYGLYEDNIGMLSPMIAEELREAEKLYPRRWIEDAIREAVRANRRSWRYVSAILERWEQEGRSDGQPGRHPKKTGYQEYFQR